MQTCWSRWHNMAGISSQPQLRRVREDSSDQLQRWDHALAKPLDVPMDRYEGTPYLPREVQLPGTQSPDQHSRSILTSHLHSKPCLNSARSKSCQRFASLHCHASQPDPIASRKQAANYAEDAGCVFKWRSAIDMHQTVGSCEALQIQCARWHLRHTC